MEPPHEGDGEMRLLRYTIGRALMHLGLNIMPKGRSRHELTILLEHWARKIHMEIIAASKETKK